MLFVDKRLSFVIWLTSRAWHIIDTATQRFTLLTLTEINAIGIICIPSSDFNKSPSSERYVIILIGHLSNAFETTVFIFVFNAQIPLRNCPINQSLK